MNTVSARELSAICRELLRAAPAVVVVDVGMGAGQVWRAGGERVKLWGLCPPFEKTGDGRDIRRYRNLRAAYRYCTHSAEELAAGQCACWLRTEADGGYGLPSGTAVVVLLSHVTYYLSDTTIQLLLSAGPVLSIHWLFTTDQGSEVQGEIRWDVQDGRRRMWVRGEVTPYTHEVANEARNDYTLTRQLRAVELVTICAQTAAPLTLAEYRLCSAPTASPVSAGVSPTLPTGSADDTTTDPIRATRCIITQQFINKFPEYTDHIPFVEKYVQQSTAFGTDDAAARRTAYGRARTLVSAHPDVPAALLHDLVEHVVTVNSERTAAALATRTVSIDAHQQRLDRDLWARHGPGGLAPPPWLDGLRRLLRAAGKMALTGLAVAAFVFVHLAIGALLAFAPRDLYNLSLGRHWTNSYSWTVNAFYWTCLQVSIVVACAAYRDYPLLRGRLQIIGVAGVLLLCNEIVVRAVRGASDASPQTMWQWLLSWLCIAWFVWRVKPRPVYRHCLRHVKRKPIAPQHRIRAMPPPRRDCIDVEHGAFLGPYLRIRGAPAFYPLGCVHDVELALCNRHLLVPPIDSGRFWQNRDYDLLYPTSMTVPDTLEWIAGQPPEKRLPLQAAFDDGSPDARFTQCFVKIEPILKPVEEATRTRMIQGPCPWWKVHTGPETEAWCKAFNDMHDGTKWYKVGDGMLLTLSASGRNVMEISEFCVTCDNLGLRADIGADAIEYDASKGEDCLEDGVRVYERAGARVINRAYQPRKIYCSTRHGVKYVIYATQPSGQNNTTGDNGRATLKMVAHAIHLAKAIAGCMFMGDDVYIRCTHTRREAICAALVESYEAAGFRVAVNAAPVGQADFCSGYFFPVSGEYRFGTKPFRALTRMFIVPSTNVLLQPSLLRARALSAWFANSHVPVLRAAIMAVLIATDGVIAAPIKSYTTFTKTYTEPCVADDTTIEWFCERYDVTSSDVEEVERYILGSPIPLDISAGPWADWFADCLARDI